MQFRTLLVDPPKKKALQFRRQPQGSAAPTPIPVEAAPPSIFKAEPEPQRGQLSPNRREKEFA